MKTILLLLIFFTSVGPKAFAEVIKLNTGQVIDGVVIEKNDAMIKVERDGQVREIDRAEIRYIRGEGLDRGSASYYGLLVEAMNEPDTVLEGWETVGSVNVSLEDSPAAKAFEKAGELFQQGRWDECIASLTEAIDGGFNLAEAYFYRATVYYNKMDMNNAILDFTRSIKYRPDNPLALGNRAECYRRLGQLQSALDDFNAALRLDPRDDLVLANRASTHYALGDLDQAVADMSSAIKFNPVNAGYYANRAGFYALAQKYDEALADIETAKSMGWSDPDHLRDQIMKIKSSPASEMTAD